MGAGNYTHTSPGSNVTLTEYDNNHQNHINNHNFDGLDDYSANATEMRSTTDPGESGSESLATSGAGELERIRFIINEIVGNTYWYESPSRSLSGLCNAKNRLYNGAMRVWQRGTTITTPNDDVYTADGWVVLSESNGAVTVSKETSDVPTGFTSAYKFTVVTANEKFGIFQGIERENCADIIGSTASLSFRIKGTGTLTKAKAAVLAWDGTADTITSDVVSSWGAEDTTPTFATNWTAENTPATITVTTSWQTVEIDNISIDTSSTKNIGVFIWCDDKTVAATNTMLVTGVQLECGIKATGYDFVTVQKDIADCNRYYTKTYDLDTAPGTSSTTAGRLYARSRSDSSGTGTARVVFNWQFPVRMRDAPTVTTYSDVTGTSGKIRDLSDDTDINSATDGAGERGVTILNDSGATIGAAERYSVQATATAEL